MPVDCNDAVDRHLTRPAPDRSNPLKLFACPQCSHQVFFSSHSCLNCNTELAYRLDLDDFVADTTSPCENRVTVEACNWTSANVGFCVSCALDTEHAATVERLEFQNAKRRTIRQLNILGVDVTARSPQLQFELSAGTDDNPVITGHEDGLITLDTNEADPAHREELRVNLGEPYRTPLGHVRHELGHWWWATAIDDRFTTAEYRALFGDESLDYQQALADHYAVADNGSWTDQYVSHYAASHPWEDFAESFAHYLHIRDTSETAAAHSIVNPGDINDFDGLYQQWVDLTVTLNDLNRSMGTPDAYPFAVPAPAVAKIAFVAASMT